MMMFYSYLHKCLNDLIDVMIYKYEYIIIIPLGNSMSNHLRYGFLKLWFRPVTTHAVHTITICVTRTLFDND